MREEIAAAVVFVTRLIKANDSIPKEKVEEFSSKLSGILIERFKNHWYADEPTKGQGYRCIRINHAEPIDPVLSKAASDSGLRYSDLNLPKELTLWVDPKEVCCRFGESQGSFCQLAMVKEDGNLENQAHIVNIDNYLEQLQREHSMNLNIVTTRTSATKLKALAMKNAAFQHQQKSSFHYNNKYQHNLYNNNNQQQQPPPNASFSSSRSFHQKSHHKNGYHSNQHSSSMNNGYGYQGNRSSSSQGHRGNNSTHNSNFNSQYQNKDKFHWVRSKQSPPLDQTEKMRLSPN